MDNTLFQYHFSTTERNTLTDILMSVSSPYKDYASFQLQLQNLFIQGAFPDWLIELGESIRNLNTRQSPAIILRNCPIDEGVKAFDHEDPVADKHRVKTQFVSEGFLQLYSMLNHSHPVAYKSINRGDHFHDIYPKKGLLTSQSQKSSITLGFHNDLPNSIVRPNWVNILCVRNSQLNRVSTTVIRNIDIEDDLSDEVKEILKQDIFLTPHEEISVHGGKGSMEGIELKPIYQPDEDVRFCYFEGRTTTKSEAGLHAIRELDKTLHFVKQPVFLEPSDFISISNNECLHAREVLHVLDEDAHMNRWLVKTFDVNNLAHHRHKLVSGFVNVVNE